MPKENPSSKSEQKERNEQYPFNTEKRIWQIRSIFVGFLKKEFEQEKKDGDRDKDDVFEAEDHKLDVDDQGYKLFRFELKPYERLGGGSSFSLRSWTEDGETRYDLNFEEKDEEVKITLGVFSPDGEKTAETTMSRSKEGNKVSGYDADTMRDYFSHMQKILDEVAYRSLQNEIDLSN